IWSRSQAIEARCSGSGLPGLRDCPAVRRLAAQLMECPSYRQVKLGVLCLCFSIGSLPSLRESFTCRLAATDRLAGGVVLARTMQSPFSLARLALGLRQSPTPPRWPRAKHK